MYRRSTLMLLLSVVALFALLAPAALAHPDAEAEVGDVLELEVRPSLVSVGDPVEVEVEFEVESDHDEADDTDEADDANDTEETEEVDDPDQADGGDEAASTAPVPTSVSLTVDYGDGSEVAELAATESGTDGDEFEVEAEGVHVYDTAGTYTLSVVATPDVGEPVSVSVTVTVVEGPVPYPRDSDNACPEDELADYDFEDVDDESVHELSIDCLVAWGLVQGTSASTYDPDAGVNRAQLATFLARVLEAADVDVGDVDDHFDDDDGSVHEDAINLLAELGLVNGQPDGTYAPDETITRAQAAAMLVRVYEYLSQQPASSDVDYFDDDDGSVHEDDINGAAGAGFTSGTSLRTFDPEEEVTRAQLASLLVRVIDLLAAEEGLVS